MTRLLPAPLTGQTQPQLNRNKHMEINNQIIYSVNDMYRRAGTVTKLIKQQHQQEVPSWRNQQT